MRRILFYLLLLNLSLFAQPDWSRSFEEARLKAAESNKPIMLMFSKEGCEACWYMENIVFKDKGVEKILDDFVPVYFDVNKDTLPKQFSYLGTPTFHFSDAEGKAISKELVGAANVKDFSSKLKKVLEAFKP